MFEISSGFVWMNLGLFLSPFGKGFEIKENACLQHHLGLFYKPQSAGQAIKIILFLSAFTIRSLESFDEIAEKFNT